MAIEELDVKLLWGQAAGICSYPGCRDDCIKYVNSDDPTLVGEMAHVIARKERGPRGKTGGGSNEYANLILLCPTHHRLVDKAKKGMFTESMLLQWKADHESWVRSRLRTPTFSTKGDVFAAIFRLLIENKAVWKTYGPESEIARSNPFSNVARHWTLKKLSTVIPNNSLIVNILRSNAERLEADEYERAAEFIEHATGFEASTYDRRDYVPRFPIQFEEMIRDGATQKQLGD